METLLYVSLFFSGLCFGLLFKIAEFGLYMLELGKEYEMERSKENDHS